MRPLQLTLDQIVVGVHASFYVNSYLEEDDHPLGASDMNELRNPAKPFCQNDLTLHETMVSNEDS